MRSKVKVTSKEDVLKNFTREFLIEEKKRCEIDRYVTDFRILIHNMPHENHNYLNRLLQDYTSMFLSHERISVNKSNEGEMKHRLRKQLASKIKESPKQRYVKSKLSSKVSENSNRQSYLVLKAKTEEFLQKLRKYEELGQIAYEIFIKHSNTESAAKVTCKSDQIPSDSPSKDHILKLKTIEVPLDIPYKKNVKHVYVVNSAESKHVNKISPNSKSVESSLSSTATTENLLTNFEYIKNKTSEFLENCQDYNNAEQSIFFEQYRQNFYIRKYAANLNIYNGDDPKRRASTKKGFFYKIKNMMGFSPEKTEKFKESTTEEIPLFKEETKTFLENEKKFNDFEFESYRLNFTKKSKFTESDAALTKKNISLKETPNNIQVEIESKTSVTSKKLPLNTKDQPEKQEFENAISAIGNKPIEKLEHIEFIFDPSPKKIEEPSVSVINSSIISSKVNPQPVTDEFKLNMNFNKNEEITEQDLKILREQTRDFLNKQQIYEDQQKEFYIIFSKEHPTPIFRTNNKRESLLNRIKHLFKFGKSDKSKEKLYYLRKLTHEFLRNEKSYCDQERNNLQYSNLSSDTQIDSFHLEKTHPSPQVKKERESRNLPPKNLEPKNQFVVSPAVLHQRSRSEDLLTFKARTKSSDNNGKKSPTSHISFSDRLKRMVGIGNRRRSKSRENSSRLTDNVQYFLDHERFNYDVDPENSKIYNRSISLVSQSGKINTIKTKTRNFLSTENILYQNPNHEVKSKPPSGRRRQERRSDDGKNKRRSRTLSPAQKLVSKLKNIVHRDSKNKEVEKENWEFLKNETEKFISDQKYFNDLMGGKSMKAYSYISENNYKTMSTNPMIDESSESGLKRNKTFESERRIIPQTSLQTKVIENIKNGEKKIEIQDRHINEIKQKDTVKPVENSKDLIKSIKSNEQLHHRAVDNSSKIDIPEFHNNEMTINANSGLSRHQTEIFLHDMKKFHDLDREDNAADKTLIFVNNKNFVPSSISNVCKSTETNTKIIGGPLIINDPITSDNNNDYVLESDIIKNVTQEKSALCSKSSTSEKIIENSKVQENRKELLKQSFADGLQRTISKEQIKVINQKYVSETNKVKSVTTFASKNNQPTVEEIVDNSKQEHILNLTQNDTLEKTPYFHRFKDKSKAIYYEENKNHSKDVTKEHIRHEKNSSGKTEKLNMPFVETREDMNSGTKNLVESVTNKSKTEEIIPSFSANQPECHEKKKGIYKIHPENYPERTVENILKSSKSNRVLRNEKDSGHSNLKGSAQFQHSNEVETESSDQETDLEACLLIQQKSLAFLKEQQDYNNRGRTEDNDFLRTRPSIIWLSERKKIPAQLDGIFPNVIKNNNDGRKQRNKVKSNTQELDTELAAAPNTESIEGNRTKSQKIKKNTFSKLKSMIKGQAHTVESTELLRMQTAEFLKHMREYNTSHCEDYSKFKLSWMNEIAGLPQKIDEDVQKNQCKKIGTKNSNEEQDSRSYILIKEQTSIFLKDLQDFNNKQRNEHVNLLKESKTPEKNLGLSTNISKAKKIKGGIKKLLSPTTSKKSLITIDDKTGKLLRDQTEAFLNKQQYFIHEQEVNSKPLSSSSDKTISSKTTTSQSKAQKESGHEIPTESEKAKTSRFSKIKSLLGGSSQRNLIKENDKLIREQTAVFLNHLKMYTDSEYEKSVKFNISWLSERKVNTQKLDEVTQQTVIRNFIENDSTESDEQKKLHLLILQQTDNFLKDHQDFHNRQGIEENFFFKKSVIPEKRISLPSTIPKKNSLTDKMKELLSINYSNKRPIITDNKEKQLWRDQTSEFLIKNRYLIYQEEVDLKVIANTLKKADEELSVPSKLITSQSAVPGSVSGKESKIKTQKAKKSTFSKIKYLIGGTADELPTKEMGKLVSKQTAEFLEHLRKYNNTEHENSAKSKIFWLSDRELIPHKLDKELQNELPHKLVKESSSEQEKSENKSHPVMKQQTDTFLKYQKDYHNQQKNEDKNFSQKTGIPEEQICLSTKISTTEGLKSKIKKLLSPNSSKKSLHVSNDKNHQFLKDQTTEFLGKNQYFIFEDEISPTVMSNSSDTSVKDVPKILERTTSQSSEPSDKVKLSTFSNIENMMSNTNKHPPIKNDNNLITNRTAEFIEHLRKYYDSEYESFSKFKIVWLSDREIIPQKCNKVVQKKLPSSNEVSGSEEEDRGYNSYLVMKQQTDTFLQDHKDYHDKQREEHAKLFQKSGIKEEQFWLSSNIPKNKSLISKMKRLFSHAQPNKTLLITNNEKNQLLKEQTAQFLRRHQYLIHEEEVNHKIASNFSNILIEKKTTTSKIPLSACKTSKNEVVKKSTPKAGKKKKSTLSEIKYVNIGTTEQPLITENKKLDIERTAEFLRKLRDYNNTQYDTSSKLKILWLSERDKIPGQPYKINQKEKTRSIIGKSTSQGNDTEYEPYLFMKQEIDTFLKNHKDYHNKQRIEDNKFLEKSSLPKEKLWSSNISRNKRLTSDSDKSLVISRKIGNQVLRDQTSEFLSKSQYYIHKEETNFNLENDESTTKTEKAKKNTFSKIKSLMTVKVKQPSIKENGKSIKQQTIEFLEEFRKFNNTEYETSSKFTSYWLSERKVIPQKLEKAHQEKNPKEVGDGSSNKQKDQEYKSYLFIKQQTDRFLKDHKNYHDKQKNEDKFFSQKLGTLEEKLPLSSNTPKNRSISSKIKKFLSPRSSNRSFIISNDESNQLLRDQTAEFLINHQYVLHEEELNPKMNSSSLEKTVEEVSVPLSITTSQSGALKDESNQKPSTKIKKTEKNTLSKIKSLTGNNAKQPPIKENDKVISKQTSAFLDHLRSYNDNEYEDFRKSSISWLSESKKIPVKIEKTIQKEISGKIVQKEKDRDNEQYFHIKKQTDIFLKDHKDYHKKQRNDMNNFLTKNEIPEYNSPLKSKLLMKTQNVTDDKALCPRDSEKMNVINGDDGYQLSKNQNIKFLSKNQFINNRDGTNPKKISELVDKDSGNQMSEKVKQSIAKKRNELLMNQTAEFLKHLKEYNSLESKAPLKNDTHKKSEKHLGLQKVNESFPKELHTKIDTDSFNTKRDPEKYMFLKQETNKFLKDHQDYHNKQRNEYGYSHNPKTNLAIDGHHHSILLNPRKDEEEVSIPKISLRRSTETKNEGVEDVSTDKANIVTETISSKSLVLANTEPSSTDESRELLKEKPDHFLRNLEEYKDDLTFQRATATSENRNSVSPERKSDKTNIIMKIKHLFSSAKPLDQNAVFYDDEAEKNQFLKELTSKFLVDQLYYIHRDEVNFREKPEKLIPIKFGEENIFFPKKYMKEIKSLHTTAMVAPKNDVIITKQTEELLKNMKEYSDIDESAHLLVKNDQNLPQVIKKKVTFLDKEGPLKAECNHISTNEKKNFREIIQETQLFLENHKDYHHNQLYRHKESFQRNTEVKEENTPSLTGKTVPILSKIRYLFSSPSTQRKNTSDESEEFKVMKYLCDEFLKKQQYMIHEDEIFQKLKPKPTPRKLKVGTKTKDQEELEKQNNFSEEFTKMRKDLIFFLQDHQTHHDKEKKGLMNFATYQIHHSKNLPKKSSVLEQKSKSKILTKLKSLVGGSTEKSILEKKSKTEIADLKKQTLEFLISQKCFWDLEGSATLRYEERKKNLEPYNHQEIVKKIGMKKKLEEETFAPDMALKKELEKSKVPGKLLDKVAVQQQDKKCENEDYKIVKEQTELFLHNHQNYHKNQMKDFIPFSHTRKQLRNECLGEGIDNQNIEPQNSSSNQKTLEMVKTTENKYDSKSSTFMKVRREDRVDPSKILNICKEFLNQQRHYTDSENQVWRRYVMYKSEVVILKKSSSQNKAAHAKKKNYLVSKITPDLNNQYSEIESRKIDHEVTLHKTKLFLENHRNYHDNLENEIAKYVPTEKYRNDFGEQKISEKKEGMLFKIKSMLPSAHNKNSYNVQKATLSTQSGNDIKTGLHYNSSGVKFADLPTFSTSTNESEVILRKRTDLFLKDHQEYHNLQKNYFIKYFGNNCQPENATIPKDNYTKSKKSNKGMMSKLKSLLGADSTKKSDKKQKDDDIFFKTPTKVFLEDQKHFSDLEKAAEKMFNDSRKKLKIKNFESSPTANIHLEKCSENSEKEASSRKSDLVEETKQKNTKEENELLTNQKLASPDKFNVIREEKLGIPISRIEEKNLQKIPAIHAASNDSSLSILHCNDVTDGSILKKLSFSELSNISENDRRKYTRDKIKTQEFLLNQKEFANLSHIDVIQNLNNSSKPPKSGDFEHQFPQERVQNKMAKRESGKNETKSKQTNIYHNNNTNEERKIVPSAPASSQYEESTDGEKNNIGSSLIQRIERPLSPTKTVFEEIRTRDSSPANRVYILNEGYTITREERENEKIKKKNFKKNEMQIQQSEAKQTTSFKIDEIKPFSADISESIGDMMHAKNKIQAEKSISVPFHESSDGKSDVHWHADIKRFLDAEKYQSSFPNGQDCSSSSFKYSHSQRPIQGDLAVGRQNTKRRTYREMEEEPHSFITETRIENNGTVTQRYTTSCYFHQVPIPVWYSESLLVDLEEKTQKMNEKVYYDNQYRPEYWSETFETEIPQKKNLFVSETVIPVKQETDEIHYISLEHQQRSPQTEIM